MICTWCQLYHFHTDEVPPVVKCPVESYIYTHDIEHTPAVWGPPTATDNVQVKDLMSTSTQFYDWLEEGRHQITYRAVDKADNSATCQFKVHVIRLGKRSTVYFTCP